MSIVRLLFFLGLFPLFAQPVFADGGKGHACLEDVQKFCPDVGKDRKAIASCLRENQSNLTSGCKDKLTKAGLKKSKGPRSAIAKACKADFEKLCGDLEKGKGRLKKCLKREASNLSDGCKSALEQISKKK